MGGGTGCGVSSRDAAATVQRHWLCLRRLTKGSMGWAVKTTKGSLGWAVAGHTPES